MEDPIIETKNPFYYSGALDLSDTNNTNAFAFGDVDGDGFYDVAVADQGAMNKVYFNNGTGGFTLRDVVTESNDTISYDIALADMAADKRVLMNNQRLHHHAIQLEPLDGNQSGKLQYYTGGQLACEMSLGHDWDDTQWHHIAIARSSANEMSIYVNGLQVGSAKVPALFNQAFRHEKLIETGYRAAMGKYPCNGAIDDIRFYNRELSNAANTKPDRRVETRQWFL